MSLLVRLADYHPPMKINGLDIPDTKLADLCRWRFSQHSAWSSIALLSLLEYPKKGLL